MRELAEEFHVLLGGALRHPVSDVEDVSPRSRFRQTRRDGLADIRFGTEENHGVDVALDRGAGAQGRPRLLEDSDVGVGVGVGVGVDLGVGVSNWV